jgi:hypothetical protein
MRLLFASPASIMPEQLNGGDVYQNFMLGLMSMLLKIDLDHAKINGRP